MRISAIAKLGSIAAAAACIGIAGAQTNGPSGLSVRLGAFLPSNSNASDLSHTWFAFGADYKLNTLSAKAPVTDTQAYFGISADYYGHGGDNDVPIALTYNVRQGATVFSAGLGPDFRNAGDLTGTGVGIGGQLGAAFEFGNASTPFFVQAKYFFASKPELSGFGIYIGARF